MPTQYPAELKIRALRLLTDHPEQASTHTCQNITEHLSNDPETLQKGTNKPKSMLATTPDTTPDMAAENRRLRKENADLNHTNKILRTASAFFAATDPS